MILFNKKRKQNVDEQDVNKNVDIDKQNFWLLVVGAYKAILPFVFVVILGYFLFTLILTRFILK